MQWETCYRQDANGYESPGSDQVILMYMVFMMQYISTGYMLCADGSSQLKADICMYVLTHPPMFAGIFLGIVQHFVD